MRELNEKFSDIILRWKKVSHELRSMTVLSGSEQLASRAEKIEKCSEIFQAYSDIMNYACEKYEENEKMIISAAEE